MTYTVTKLENVPVPAHGGGLGRKFSGVSNEIRGMADGTCLEINGRKQQNVVTTVGRITREAADGRKYITRKQPDGSVRVWRIS